MKGNFSCAYNMDTGCVELTAPEDELNLTSRESADLDWLIYHKPLEYLNLVFLRRAGNLPPRPCYARPGRLTHYIPRDQHYYLEQNRGASLKDGRSLSAHMQI